MSLFSKLIQFRSDERCRLEDFHTEIVAHVLAANPEMTLRWLRDTLSVSGLVEVADKVTVTPQVKLEAIEGLHDEGSKIDMVIKIRKGRYNEIVFIESKVGSHENDGQLPKYMDHLRALHGVDRRSLVFITRDYEQREDISDEKEQIKFKATRWSEFYRFLSSLESPSDTIRELLRFMKENNMSQNTRFNAIDLIALTNHSRARSLMSKTLGESVAEKWEKEILCKPSEIDKVKLLLANKYALYGYPANEAACDHVLKCELGYWFPGEQPSDSPIVGMRICVNPGSTSFSAISDAMSQFSKASKGAARKWVYIDSCNDEGWEGIECMRKLEEFFSEEDHVAAIAKWFEELIDDSVAFRKLNRQLPWESGLD